MKILNLYAGIGGNRKLWGKEHRVTAIENAKETEDIYHENFPDDELIITDAHNFLLEYYKEYDFIWSSPPCPSHSRTNYFLKVTHNIIRYPDMKLYEEIILLQTHFKGKYCVENVVGYYEPLIKPQKIHRHYFWANFIIPKIKINNKPIIADDNIKDFEKYYGFDLSKHKGVEKRAVLRNCVHPKLGLHIFNCAFKEQQGNQKTLL
ncbi:hypothetical protein LCGC14_1809730 [marine sediment metagenome]|uniref:DNA (cytosine-5-)-methyltransferase n=1 Tax=marine sediment metagenome TaxID=412755 RepID=A0A0F9J1X8_9ZZZZ